MSRPPPHTNPSVYSLKPTAYLVLCLILGTLSQVAKAAEFQVGDRIVVTTLTANLMAGKKIVATAQRDQEFRVERVSGSWLLVSIETAGKRQRGWLYANSIARAIPRPVPKKVPRKTTQLPKKAPKSKKLLPTQPNPQPVRKKQPRQPEIRERGTILKKLGVLAGHTEDIYTLSFSADGKMLASGGADKSILVWDVDARKQLFALTGHKHDVRCVKFSPIPSILVSGGGQITGGELKLWNLRKQNLMADLPDVEAAVVSLDFSVEGTMLFTAGWRRTVAIWNLVTLRKTGEIRASFSDMVQHVAISPEGEMVATNGKNGLVYLREFEKIATGSKSPLTGLKHILRGHSNIITALEFSSDGKLLATGSNDRTAVLWDVESGEIVSKMKNHPAAVQTVAFSPENRLLVTGSLGGDVPLQVWAIPSGKLLAVVKTGPVFDATFSPDGRLLATTDGSHVQLWTVQSDRGR